MCNCGNLIYAKKHHSHPYVDAMNATLVDYYTKAEIDDLLAVLQAQVDECCSSGNGCVEFADEFTTDLDGWSISEGFWIVNISAEGELRCRHNPNDDLYFQIDYALPVGLTLLPNHQLELAWSSQAEIDFINVQMTKAVDQISLAIHSVALSDASTETVPIANWSNLVAGDVVDTISIGAKVKTAAEDTRVFVDYIRLVCT